MYSFDPYIPPMEVTHPDATILAWLAVYSFDPSIPPMEEATNDY
jgi:hypothetical protein